MVFQLLPIHSTRESLWLSEISPWFTGAMLFQVRKRSNLAADYSAAANAETCWSGHNFYILLTLLVRNLRSVDLPRNDMICGVGVPAVVDSSSLV